MSLDYRKKVSKFKYMEVSAVLTSLLFSICGCSNLSSRVPQSMSPQASGQEAALQPNRLGTGVSTNITQAAEKVIPSVVGITATITSPEGKKGQGVGSGIIVDTKGHILTNNHVAGKNVGNIVVSLYDGREISGKTAWADPVLDLAIVKIEADRLQAAALGNSQGVRVGEPAIAIGNPLGMTFQRSVTAGIISAVNRTIEVQDGAFMEGLLQTDASINPGNSGGPLINANGEVIGVNTIKVLTAEGMGFAVPVNIAKPVINKISNDGGFATPTMGIQGLDRELSRAYGFTIERGVYVYNCKDGGCAYKAGIRKGDIILSIDGRAINTAEELRESIYNAGVGKKVRLRVKDRDRNEKDLYITLEEWK